MSLSWLARFEGSPWRVVVPAAVVLLLIFFSVHAVNDGGRMVADTSPEQLIGVLLMFSLLPVYLVGMLIVLWHHSANVLSVLAPFAQPADLQRCQDHLHRARPLVWLLVLFGFAFGLWQNRYLLDYVFGSVDYAPLDIAVLCGNALVWAAVGMLIGWAVPLSRSLSQLGRGAQVDLYRLDRVRPLGRLATYSVLTVAGSMAFMPLQSLDAEFRWVNYEAGILVGVPAAILLFLLPLWGVRDNIRQRKAQRLAELNAQIDKISRDDVAQLETLVAHVERVRNLPDWPVDLGQMARVLGYVVIPPLAWVGAALVENLVDRVTG